MTLNEYEMKEIKRVIKKVRMDYAKTKDKG